MDSNPKNSKPYVGEPKPWNGKHHIFAFKNLCTYCLQIDWLHLISWGCNTYSGNWKVVFVNMPGFFAQSGVLCFSK